MSKVLNNKNLSLITNWFIWIIILIMCFNVSKWNHRNVIEFDAVHYYSYLPAIFIEKDITVSFYEKDPVGYWNNNKYRPLYTIEGQKVIKTSMGLAIFYAPFFFLAHGYATIFGEYNADGFSLPYQMAISLASVFYFILGSYFLRKLLLIYFVDWVVSITLISIFFGTNLLNYVIYDAAMPHVYGFSSITIFIYSCIKWHETKLLKYTIFIGLLLGLITLMRPTNGLIGLFFILYGTYSRATLLQRINMFSKNYIALILMMLLAFIVILPQLLYWKYITGSYVFNSYIGERFYFNNPHIIDGLFSYRKGWLLYTPLMVLAFIGIPLLWKSNRVFLMGITVYLFITIYLAFSWWAWWYGASFSQRCMIDNYGLLAIPFAQTVYFLGKNINLRPILIGILVILIPFNLFQTYQYQYYIIHWDSMTKEAYWASFGKITMPNNYNTLLKEPNYQKAMRGKEEYKR